jgi:putative flippase GtrA
MKELTFHNLFTYIKENSWLLIRYGISGVSGVIANLILFTIVVEWFDVWYIFGALLGFAAAYIVTFAMHKWWTFGPTAKERTLFQSALYLCSALGTLVINTVLLYSFVEWVGVRPVLGQFAALGISAIMSFIFTSQVTFHANEKRGQDFFDWLSKRCSSLLKRKWSYPILLLGFLILIAVFRISFMPITFSSDSAGYVATAEFIAGEGGEFIGARYLKPLAPGIVALIAETTSASYPTALLIQAFLGYILLGFAAYWFGMTLWNDRRAGILLSILVATSYPILRYGLDFLTETGAWTLYFAALAGTVLWYRRPSTKLLWLTSIIILLGLLWKEYAVLAGVVYGLAIIFQPSLSYKEKFYTVMQGFCLVLLPWIIWQGYVYFTYEYSYLDWLAIGASGEAYQNTYTLFAVIKSLAGLLLFSWVFVLIGFWKYPSFESIQKRFIQFLALPSFGFLLWGWVSTRLFFSLVPLVGIFAVHGIRTLFSFRVQLVVLLFISIMNLTLVWFTFNPDIRTILNDFAYDTDNIKTE